MGMAFHLPVPTTDRPHPIFNGGQKEGIPVITVQHLHKGFGAVHAFKGISLHGMEEMKCKSRF